MADMPSSGTITFDDLLTVFGGSEPVSLSAYYRGGSLVPDITKNAGVPTSGAISLADFYGAGTLPGGTLTAGNFHSGATNYTGYVSGLAGSISPTAAFGGTIALMAWNSDPAVNSFIFELTGLSADPGQSAFTDLTTNSLTLASSAATYSYSAGVAAWKWTGGTHNPSYTSGNTYDWAFS